MRILVTGARGFLGQWLVERLWADGHEVPATDSLSHDLCNVEDAYALFDEVRPERVYHLAGFNGGIEFNRQRPAEIFFQNTAMALNVIAMCAEFKVQKVVSVVASCAYPELEVVPEQWDTYGDVLRPRAIMRESDLHDGPPHGTVSCHGYAKRNLQLASHFAHKQYGLNAVCACPTTLYGPGDSFDPERTKVMGGMVKRFVDAHAEGRPSVTCWGTGAAMREFLYVGDCAELLTRVMDKYDDSSEPINLGTGQEVTVKALADAVAAEVGYSGEIFWDTTRPDGQLRKRLDLDKCHSVLGPFAPTSLATGIQKTVEYYRYERDYQERRRLTRDQADENCVLAA